MEKENKKKGFFGFLKKSMDKTSGCNCGPGDACYTPPEEEKVEQPPADRPCDCHKPH